MSLLDKSVPYDEQLVRAIKQDDPDAFKQLYFKYFKMLIRFAWIRTRSMDMSRDFVQEIFSRIWLKRDQLNPEKSIKAYLYKSLNNLIINQSKSSSSQITSLERISTERSIDRTNSLDLKLDVQNALNQLPEKLKIVYVLSRIEGYKYSEIAEICSISEKAVEKRMTQAFKLLRKALG